MSFLPFLGNKDKNQGNAGLIVKVRQSDEKVPEDKNDPDAAKEACGRDLLNAIKAGDALAVGQALYDAAHAADMEEHEEGPHESKHDYDSQNEKAADNE